MSIGEYYKLLMEGKRPTRQRTVKEDIKMMTPQPTGLARGGSTSLAATTSGGMQHQIRKDSGLSRSQSELPPRITAVVPKHDEGQHKSHSKLNKRKHKLKSKMKYVRESSTPSQHDSTKPRLFSHEEHKSPTAPFQQNKSPGSSALPQDLSSAENQSALSKLRQRDRQQSSTPIDQFKKKKLRREIDESSNEEVRQTKRDEEAMRKQMMIQTRFELVEVHPLFAKDRYACKLPSKLEDASNFAFSQITSVDLKNFDLKLAGNPLPQSYDQCLFLSQIYALEISQLSDQSKTLVNKQLGTTDSKATILVGQIVPHYSIQVSMPLVALISIQSDEIMTILVSLNENSSTIDDLRSIGEREELKEETKEDQKDTIRAAYKSQKDLVLAQAKKINQGVARYVEKTSRVQVEKDNLEDLMFTIIHYQSQEVQITQEDQKNKNLKEGVFLRAKLDTSFYNEHLIFLKKLGGLSKVSKLGGPKEVRSEWLQLSKHRIYSDFSKGFISIDCLSIYQDGTSRLRKRNLKFISYRESLKQRESLKRISDETLENCKEDIRKAIMARDSKPGDRCILCNYQAQGYEHLKCSCCKKVVHEECVKREPKRLHQLCLGIREQDWRCQDCIRCVNCLGKGGKSHSQQLLICKCCNSGYHYDCMDPNVKMSMPNVTTIDQTLDLNFNCERCVQCEQCGAREAGKNRLNKWSKDFKLCSNCNKKRKKNQLCIVCESFWPDEILQDTQIDPSVPTGGNPELQQINNKLQEHLNNKMINCGKCQIWVHYECDRIFQDEGIKKMFLASKGLKNELIYGSSFTNEFLQYHCIDCRQQQRSALIRQIIENLAGEDKLYYFQDPVEHLIVEYTKIIKTPMCFKYIRDRAKGTSSSIYLTDPSALRRDIAQIFENAIKFNLPKHKVHKEASRLGIVCQAVLDSVWTRLELNASRTIDENNFKELLRYQRRFRLAESLREQGMKMLREDKKEGKEKTYQLKLEELFDQSEYQPQNETQNIGENLPGQSQDATRRYAVDFQDEDEENDIEMENEAEFDDDDFYEEDVSERNGASDKAGGSASKIARKSGGKSGSANRKRDLRTRKNVDYNEEKTIELGKRIASGILADEGLQRMGNNGQYSSKKARYQQQQAQFAQQFPFNSVGQIKGANLLQQALHQQEKNMQSQNIESNQVHSSLNLQTNHASADQAKTPFQEQQAQMMKLYQEIDDERCYYSNPARCSFDDPCLVFEEMCYLCGSFGCRKDFLSCTLCGESFHTYCLQLLPANCNDNDDDSSPIIPTEEEEQSLIQRFQPYWKCLNCKFCDICSSATQEAFLLYCDVCDKAFHSFCWTPQLKLIPKCSWKCSECFKCTKCSTRRFFDPTLHMKPGTNILLDHIVLSCQNDFEFSQNFSLCYECGMNEHKKSFCKICQSKTVLSNLNTDEANNQFTILTSAIGSRKKGGKQVSQIVSEQDKMLKCRKCGYYCHIRCSRLLPTVENEEFEEIPEDFMCLECLLTGKSINHLIRETCEHYENMHQILNRHRLLAQLCSDILASYFPMPDKAPVFIKAFIEQNQDFFRSDEVVVDWLSLLETGVSYIPATTEEESTNNVTSDHVQQIPMDPENIPNGKNQKPDWKPTIKCLAIKSPFYLQREISMMPLLQKMVIIVLARESTSLILFLKKPKQ